MVERVKASSFDPQTTAHCAIQSSYTCKRDGEEGGATNDTYFHSVKSSVKNSYTFNVGIYKPEMQPHSEGLFMRN